MVEVFRAKSGDLTASVSGIRVHSQHDPRKEAQRFVERSFDSRCPSTVVVLGTGLGYLLPELRHAYPSCRIIALSLLDVCREEYRGAADAYISGNAPDLSGRILRAIRPQDIGGLELIQWQPVLHALPEVSQKLEQALRAAVSQRNADIATTGFFGRKYIRNACRTALFADAARSPAPRSLPVCIAASGPSIAEAANWIITYRDRLELWALSSATAALAARGITPDLVIHQDAGFYAYEHLTTPARGEGTEVLMPITAVLPPRPLRSCITLFSQSTSVEDEIYAALGVRPLRIRETGTVSATATSLALELTSGPVYLAGLDLSQRDIEAHARPHAFEHYLWRRENRLAPVFSAMAAQTFDGTTPLEDTHSRDSPHARGRRQDSRRDYGKRYRTNRGLDAYTEWFRRLPPESAARLYRVCPSPVTIGAHSATDASPPEAEQGRKALTEQERTTSTPRVRATASSPLLLPEGEPRRRALRELVDTWRQRLEKEVSGSWIEREDAAGEELSYLISAPDYVAAVAAARRGDAPEREHRVRTITETAQALFSRLEYLIDGSGKRPTGGYTEADS